MINLIQLLLQILQWKMLDDDKAKIFVIFSPELRVALEDDSKCFRGI